MRISSARIRGFRCIGDVVVEFDDLTALVGSGGVGKSTILNAIDWFFRGGDLEERDLHLPPDSEDHVQETIVAVTFSDLNDADREVLGGYVQGETTTLTRSWNTEDGQKLSGNALVFVPFEEVREADGAVELRNRYRALYESQGAQLELPAPTTKREDIEREMEVWEREHPELCEARTRDARHLGGFTGTPLLQSRFDYVLVGATAGAPEALGGGRNSVLDRLLSVVEELGGETKAEIEELQDNAQREIRELVTQARGGDLLALSTNLSARAADYFPGAAIKLTDEVEPPRPPSISVRALISDRGGHPIDPELQGHGLQRALVIALLHELAESTVADGQNAEASPRALLLAIEEPELYQHPLQARALASSLESLSTGTGPRSIQVAYSTHSPYFTRAALFEDLRLCSRTGAQTTSCVAADPAAIAAAVAESGYETDTASRVKRALAENLREAIFARSVILCEGESDAAVLEGVGEVQGGLDRDGVAVAYAGTKSALIIAAAILGQLEIPYFVLFDADGEPEKVAEAARNRQILVVCGEEGEDWPQREVRGRSANFADRLETDLADIWPQFDEARKEVAEELGVKATKKDHRVYREAVERAGEPPEFLLDVLDAGRGLAQ